MNCSTAHLTTKSQGTDILPDYHISCQKTGLVKFIICMRKTHQAKQGILIYLGYKLSLSFSFSYSNAQNTIFEVAKCKIFQK